MKAKMKLNKLMSILLCCLMLTGVFTTPAYAWDTETHCDFCGEFIADDWICGGGDHCGPESGRGNCFEENHCEDCGDCRDDMDWCEDCHMHIQCAVDNNKHCPDCYECTAEEGCQLCYRCFNCGDVCSDLCDDICLECHRKEGVACENCDTCYVNDDTVFCPTCKLCHNCTGGYCESCGQCGDDVDLCDGCGNYCSECALICPECGENCSECYGVFCPSCYTCDHCATLCADCGYCDNCLDMCLSCERCEDCTSMCQSCHEYCADCVNMCVGCDTCENCADVCKVCQEMCTNCGTICKDCGSCMNCCEANIGYAYVNITKPAAGAHPEDAVSGSEHVWVYSTEWRYGTDFKNTMAPSDTFKAGETYQAVVKLLTDEGYKFYDDPLILVNRNTHGIYSEYTPDSLEFTITFTVPATAGYTVSGTATSFNSDTDEVIIQLTENGALEAAYEAVVKGNTASYTIEGVASGTYTMKVMKQDHVMREYTVTVSADNVTQDVKICLLGDVNMDGAVSITDATEVQKAIVGLLSLNEYQNKLADVNKDGSVSIVDATQIQKYSVGLIDKF